MESEAMIDEDAAWAAFAGRDRTQDGRFVMAVRSTGVYCRPGCPARTPKRENVSFFADGAAAREAGFRPCLRCRPDALARDAQAVSDALAILERGEALSLEALGTRVGYAPHHFHRLFKRATGTTPAAYARGLRAARLAQGLKETNVTDAIYDAGYSAPSRAYADADAHFGMTPSAWAKGGQGARIRFAVAQSSLGQILVAATVRGLCRISFDEGEADLRARFPKADIVAADATFEALVREVVMLVDDPARAVQLPVDVQGTVFQQAVWNALRAIPPGETRTYAQIAAATGRSAATRAAGSACGSNALAVLVPCHRVLRSDGALGGYAWGLDRKKKLLARERGD